MIEENGFSKETSTSGSLEIPLSDGTSAITRTGNHLYTNTTSGEKVFLRTEDHDPYLLAVFPTAQKVYQSGSIHLLDSKADKEPAIMQAIRNTLRPYAY